MISDSATISRFRWGSPDRPRSCPDHLDHAHADGRQRAREVLGEIADLADLHARTRLQFERVITGPGLTGPLDLDAEIGELHLHQPRHGLQGLFGIAAYAGRASSSSASGGSSESAGGSNNGTWRSFSMRSLGSTRLMTGSMRGGGRFSIFFCSRAPLPGAPCGSAGWRGNPAVRRCARAPIR